MDGLSMDLEAANRSRLAAVFPECFSEGKLDLEKLLALCGSYTADDFEKYEFRWKGKADCLKLAQKRSAATLRPCREESVDFDTTQNLYLEGDNLEVLKLLQTAYYRQVKMIYIDPPYNTGHDFVYADDFADPLAKYKEVTQQATKSNPETMGRYHTNWLNMMYPRLRLASNLLRDDGVIFISIDDNEIDNLKKLCNEVFGEENFVAQIVWQKRTSPDARKKLSTGHEYLLMYSKNMAEVDSSLNLLNLSDEDKKAFKNPDNDPRGPWVSSDFTAQGYRPNQVYIIKTPGGAEYTPPAGHCWKNVESLFLQQVADGRFWFGADGKGVPRRKTYLAEREGKNLWTWWPNSEVGHTQEATQEVKALFEGKQVFDFPKPVRLLKRICQIVTKPDDLILDFFSGSAVTAHAVMQLNAEDGGNRRFILVQLPELCPEDSEAFKAGYRNICEIGKERIRRAARKIKEANPLFAGDMGFKVFKLDSSNLKLWDGSPLTQDDLLTLSERLNDMIDRVKPDRTDEDVIAEIMLKLGVPLTEPVSKLDFEGHAVYSIGKDSLLLICLQDKLSTEDLEKMAEYVPGTIVLSESALADDSAMSNAHYILKNHGIELKLI
jgi:adenine-specific DNA-methyltransferase